MASSMPRVLTSGARDLPRELAWGDPSLRRKNGSAQDDTISEWVSLQKDNQQPSIRVVAVASGVLGALDGVGRKIVRQTFYLVGFL